MLFHHVAVAALSIIEAPEIVSSASIEAELAPAAQRLGLQPGIIEALTGVRERRLFGPDKLVSDVATEAARAVLGQVDLDPAKIGVIVSTSVSKDMLEPSVASAVHGNLGLAPSCLNFDLGNACLAFLNGMEVVAAMIERGQLEYALVVDGEQSRQVLMATLATLRDERATPQSLRDHFATLTLGSGAAAMLLCRDDSPLARHRFNGGVSLAATQWNHLCRGSFDGMITDAAQLLKAGVTLATETFALARAELGWRPGELDGLVMHQVGSIHMSTLLRALELDPLRAFITYERYGNIGPVAIPFTLAKAIEAERLHTGDKVALMGIGSGLNCAMMEWVH